jgi:hypothetical protein
MTKNTRTSTEKATGNAKEDRLAAALRANLARRKARDRASVEPPQDA